MGRKKGGTNKLNKFKDLDKEWCDGQASKDTEGIYKDICTIAMNDVQLRLAKALDQDLINLKEKVKYATEVYSEGAKANRLKIEFNIQVLDARGVAVPSVNDFLKKAANGDLEE